MIGVKTFLFAEPNPHSVAYGASVVGSLPTLSTLVPLSAGLRCKDNTNMLYLYRFSVIYKVI